MGPQWSARTSILVDNPDQIDFLLYVENRDPLEFYVYCPASECKDGILGHDELMLEKEKKFDFYLARRTAVPGRSSRSFQFYWVRYDLGHTEPG